MKIFHVGAVKVCLPQADHACEASHTDISVIVAHVARVEREFGGMRTKAQHVLLSKPPAAVPGMDTADAIRGSLLHLPVPQPARPSSRPRGYVDPGFYDDSKP